MSDTFDFSTSRYDRFLTPDEGPQAAPITPPPEPPADGEVAELVSLKWMRIVPQAILCQVEEKLRQQQEAQH